MITIPDYVYTEAAVDSAIEVLYAHGLTPEQYKEEYEKRFRKEYALGAMADARDAEREDNVRYED